MSKRKQEDITNDTNEPISREQEDNLPENLIAPSEEQSFNNFEDATTFLSLIDEYTEESNNSNSDYIGHANNEGHTFLHYVALIDHKDIVREGFTISNVDTNKITPTGSTALHTAAENGNIKALRGLLEGGIGYGGISAAFEITEIDLPNAQGETPLHLAATKGHKAAAKYLISRGADIYSIDNQGATPLQRARENGYLDVVKLLEKESANEDYCNDLRQAAIDGDLEIFPSLLEGLINYSLNIDSEDDNGNTALHLAAMHGHTKIVELLLKAGAAPENFNHEYETPLHLAAKAGFEESVAFILEFAKNFKTINLQTLLLDWLDENGHTALFWAARYGYTKIVKLLIEAGADVNETGVDREEHEDGDLYPPILHAAENGYIEIVDLLIKAGAKVNDDGTTELFPLRRAASKGHKEVVRLLIEAGAEIDQTTTDQQTALHNAAENGCLDIVKLLLQYGADINKDCFGASALYYAATKKHKDIVMFLIKNGARVIDKKTKNYNRINDDNILAMLEAQEYAEKLFSNELPEPINLTKESAEIIISKMELKLKQNISFEGKIIDLNELESYFQNHRTSPAVSEILDKIASLKECFDISDMEAARKLYEISTVATFDQLKNNIWNQGDQDNYLKFLKLYAYNKHNNTVIATLNALKNSFNQYLAAKKNYLKKIGYEDSFKVPNKFIEDVEALFSKLSSVVSNNTDKRTKIEFSEIYETTEEKEALLFYALFPKYQCPGFLTNKLDTSKVEATEYAAPIFGYQDSGLKGLAGKMEIDEVEDSLLVDPAILGNDFGL
jgi:ankyrin repeat protein